MFIGEQPSGSVTEFESRDATFLENNFPTKGEINQDLSLYEIRDQDNLIVTNRLMHISDEHPIVSHPSGSKTIDKPIESQIRHSNRGFVPKRYFPIDRETFMIAMQDDEEPKSVNEALTCSAKEKWLKVIEEEMKSMRSNNVWKLVDLPQGRKAI